MRVLYQSDNNYAPYMGVSICSLFENNKGIDSIIVYIINDNISDDNINKLNSLAKKYDRSIVYLSGDRILEDKEISNTFEYTKFRKNTHSYFKLFLDRLLPEIDDRIIYIDCDTVVEGDISELDYYDMKDNVIGMVQDSLVSDAKVYVGLPNDVPYYNSGVILFDMKKWKESNCSQRLLEHIKNVRKYGTVDQDVLNVVLHDEIINLDIRYNFQPIHIDYSYEQYCGVYKHKEVYYSKSDIDKALADPGIIHFLRYVGESPWNKDNVHPDTEYFDKYLEISPWCGLEKEPSRKGIIFKIEKILYKVLPKTVFIRIFYMVHDRMIKKSNELRN